MKNVCDYIISKYKKIDILINNAAKQTENEFFKMSTKEFSDYTTGSIFNIDGGRNLTY